ncbi:MAG: 4-hydroxybenzoate octaprenyltransferase [Candidatus Eisenbacteria bacterium]|nr:4-hydroxybenzoate octaprenyltransferase [Candidatus Eisenbacteria bacterium]
MATVSAPPASSAAPIGRLRTYASFVRFEHTLFSLPLILAGVFSARGPALAPLRWMWIALAAVGARTAAMVLNRLIDRRLDALNPRTRTRELPAGRMRVIEGWALLGGNALLYVVACAALGPWFLRVAAIPLAVFTLYPYLKRWTPLCHIGVGTALALAPLAGFAAAHPDLAHSAAAWWLAAFALCWVSGFDIIYATLDEDFDRLHRLRSMVVWLGRDGALRVAAALHFVAFLCLACATGALLLLSPLLPDWAFPAVIAGLTVTGVLLYLEQRWADDVHLAFFKVNVVVGFAVLATVLIARAAGRFR